ncbi:cytochrome b5-like heme/steroid binding domain-containing protein, partial [Jimgerdemannia flammicorona]
MVPVISCNLEPRVYSLQEIALLQKALKKTESESGLMKFVLIDNKVYDVTDFISEHPGGQKVIETHVGKDATDIFHAMHPESAYEVLANNYVGDLETQEPKKVTESFEHDMRELRDFMQKEGWFKSSKSYYARMVALNMAILSVSVTILYLYGHTTAGVLISATIMGLFWQQSGWLAHDFAHHQVFEERSQNDAMVMFLGAFCLGFSLS